jgi:hypothetical protein
LHLFQQILKEVYKCLITKTLPVLQARFFIYQGFDNIYQVVFINSRLSKVVLKAEGVALRCRGSIPGSVTHFR